jgi:hypothetical protein
MIADLVLGLKWIPLEHKTAPNKEDVQFSSVTYFDMLLLYTTKSP